MPLAGTRNDFVSLDVHNRKIWATATDKSIYYYDKNTRPKDYAGTYKITITKILMNAPEYKINKKIDIYGTIGIYVESKSKSGSIKINASSNQKTSA